MSTFHILNGDCLAEKFPKDLEGERIIWRECLIDGPVSEDDFFENRAKFIQDSFGETREGYSVKVLSEFGKISGIPENSEVYFWFEDDLFCQVNFWFLLSQFVSGHSNLFAVFPIFNDESERWKGFGNHDSKDLKKCFVQAKRIELEDLNLGQKLWKAFSEYDLEKLKNLSKSKSQTFRKLEETVIANENRFNGILEKEIAELAENEADFNQLFREFSIRFGIYGFGDLQLKQYLP